MAAVDTVSEAPELRALDRVIGSFQKLLDDCGDERDSLHAGACLAVARELYVPVRELAEQIRLTHGEVPSIRARIARLDEQLA